MKKLLLFLIIPFLSNSQINFKKVFWDQLSSSTPSFYNNVSTANIANNNNNGYFVASSTGFNFYSIPATSDIDFDGIENFLDPDIDGDGVGNLLDLDVDNDSNADNLNINSAFIKLNYFDSNHNIIWSSTYSLLDENDYFLYGSVSVSAIEHIESTQNVIVAGSIISEMQGIQNTFLAMFDTNGNLLWEKSLSNDITIKFLKAKFEANANGFLAVGRSAFQNSEEQAIILNFNNDGDILDSQKLYDDFYYPEASSEFKHIASNPIIVADLSPFAIWDELYTYAIVGVANSGLTDDKDILLALYYADENDQNNSNQYDPQIAYSAVIGKNIDYLQDQTFHEDAECVFVPKNFVLNLEEEVENLTENLGIIIGGSYFIKDALTCTTPTLYGSFAINFLPFYELINWSKIYQLSDYSIFQASPGGSEKISDIISNTSNNGYFFNGSAQFIGNNWDGFLMDVDFNGDPIMATSFGGLENDYFKTSFRDGNKINAFGYTENYLNQFTLPINNSSISYLVEYDPFFASSFNSCDDQNRPFTNQLLNLNIGTPENMPFSTNIWDTNLLSKLESFTIDSTICFNQTSSAIEPLVIKKKIIGRFDLLGRETTNKGFQLHIYDDGSVQKKYVIE